MPVDQPMQPATGGSGAAPAQPAGTARPPQEPRLNSTGRTMTIVAPLNDRDRYLGDVDLLIRPDDAILVSLDRLLELAAPRLDPKLAAELRGIPTEQGFVPLAVFSEHGLTLTFDKRLLQLRLEIASTDRALQTIRLSDNNPALVGEFQSPAPFTAYLNFRGSVDYVQQGTQKGLGNPFVLVDGAARFAGVVLEGEGEYNGQERQFRRRGTRLVYDNTNWLARLTAGDLISDTRGFQGAVDIAGIGISRTYALLDPRRNVAPRGGQTFSLDRDATVEAVVNGRTVRVLRLQPGTYNVSDFPFAQGGNDVQLVITDNSGRRDVLSFTTFIERSQLARGLSEYNLQLGSLTDRIDGISYSGDLAVSGYYRRGISDTLTLGANFQYAKKAYLAGAEAVLGTPWGTIGGDIAFSQTPTFGSGWAANFSIERVTQGDHGGTSLIATVETRSRRFGSVSQFAPDNPYSINANISYSRSLGPTSFIAGQLRYAKARGDFVDESSARVSFGFRLNRRLNIVLDGEYSKGIRGSDKSFRISLTQRFGERTSARAEYDSSGDRMRLGLQSSSGYGIGSWNGVANLDRGNGQYTLNASGNYVTNRADIGLAHTTAYSSDTNSISDQRTSLRIGTSIAFAGGAFAIGRPISDSFAIMRNYKGAGDVTITVDPSQGSYQARSGTFGPALYGQLGSYSPRNLTYDVPDAPAGLDIGTGSLRTYPPYRAGYLVTVGSDYNVMIVGRLTLDGEPLSLRVGYATEVGGDGRKVELFTNRQGRFGATGLRPGRWRIEMTGDPAAVYEVDIGKSASGIVRLGEISAVEGQ